MTGSAAGTRAVRAMENLERGILDVRVEDREQGGAVLVLTNIGGTPVWLIEVEVDQRATLWSEDEGLVCLRINAEHAFFMPGREGVNPGIVHASVKFRDALNAVRFIVVDLRATDGRWRVKSLRDERGD